LGCGSSRFVEAGGRRLHLQEWGAPGRPALLLLHSAAAHSHWWDWAAPLWADRFRVLALDLRGHGLSERAGTYTFDDHAGDVASVAEGLGGPVTVVGHSMGAYVGLTLAAGRPGLVGTLVIADMLTSWAPEQSDWARKKAGEPARRFASREEAGRQFRLSPRETHAPAERLIHLGEAGAVERGPGAWEWAFDPQVLLHPPVDPWPLLPRVACPTLVVRGEGSAIMEREAAEKAAQAVPRGEFAELPGAYHHLIVDDPAGFAALLGRWLDPLNARTQA
jgi:pimeloyl-ACP methyl ester carboxylesterase